MDPKEERKRRKGIIDYANQAKNTINASRLTVGLASRITSSSLAPVIGALAFALFLTVFIIFMVGGGVDAGTPGNNVPGEEEVTPPPSTTCTDLAVDPAACLYRDFGVIVRDSNKAHLIAIYNILAIPGASPTYKSLLLKARPTYIDIESGSCHGSVDGAANITLYGFFTECGATFRQFLLFHETGHVIAITSGRLYTSFYNDAYYPHDPSCYVYVSGNINYHYYLKTYPYTFALGLGGRQESFPEAIALYVQPRGVLSNFKTQCPIEYNWEKTNIFGGVEF